MVLISIINGALLVVMPWGIPLASGAGRKDLGLTAEDFGRNVKRGAVAFAVVTPLIIAVNALAIIVWKPNRHPLERMLRDEASPLMIVLAYVSAVVLAPVAEELIFRGVIQGWLRGLLNRNDPLVTAEIPPRPRPWFRWLPRVPAPWATRPDEAANPYHEPQSDLGDVLVVMKVDANGPRHRVLPIVLTSLLFAAVHFDQMPAPLAIFPLSLVLGLLYETTGSLVPSVVLHALFNGFNTTLLLGSILAGSQLKS